MPILQIEATLQSSHLRHQYGFFGGKSQTSFSRNATRVGSEEGRLFSQARGYTSQLFLSYRQKMSIKCRDFEDDMNTSKDSRRRPKTSEDVRSLPKIAEAETTLTFPSPSLKTCIAKHNFTPSAFYFMQEVSSFKHRF